MKERVSQLIDHDLPNGEQEAIMRALAESVDGREVWERYHVIRAVLRREVDWVLPAGFADRVNATLGTERPGGVVVRSWFWRESTALAAGRLALAAAVAAVAIIGLRMIPMAGTAGVAVSPAGTPVQIAQRSASGAAPSGEPLPLETAAAHSEVSWSKLDPATQRRLNTLLLEHDQVNPVVGADGFMGYVRIVGYGRSERLPTQVAVPARK